MTIRGKSLRLCPLDSRNQLNQLKKKENSHSTSLKNKKVLKV